MARGIRPFCPRVLLVATNGVRFIQAGLACCGVEASATDLLSAVGCTIASADETTNILVVAGTVTKVLGPTIESAYQQLIEPKVVIAFGVCAITGGPYWDSYSVLPGASTVIPVDINVPGCPPTPKDLAKAIGQARELAKK